MGGGEKLVGGSHEMAAGQEDSYILFIFIYILVSEKKKRFADKFQFH